MNLIEVFLWWLLCGAIIWLTFCATVTACFYFFDKTHSLGGIIVSAIAARVFVIIIPMLWIIYGTYLVATNSL